MEWFTFRAAERLFGIKAGYVYRVVDDVRITPVPLTPTCHMGLMYYRGELFDVIHMGAVIKQVSPRLEENNWIVLIKWEGRKMALVPGKVVGLLWTEDEGTGDVFAGEEKVILISPAALWKRLAEGNHGSR